MKTNTYFTAILILIFCIISVILCGCCRTNLHESFDKDIQLVISRYNENLEWLHDSPFNQYSNIIYNKSDNDLFQKSQKTEQVVNLTNVGRCDHTYLHHIIDNYNNLADITVFLPGSTNMETKLHKAKKVVEEIERTGQSAFIGVKYKSVKDELYDFQLDEWKASNLANAQINAESNLEPAHIRPYGKWYEEHFGETHIEYVAYSGIFSVDKRDILQHPKSYYETLIKELENTSNPEVGHYFERSWAAVFYPMKHSLIIEE